MSTMFLAFIGMWETVAILAVVLILFGARKLPELAKGLGSGIKEFRKATREVNQDLQAAFDEDEPVSPPTPRKKVARKPKQAVSETTSEPKD